MSCVIITKEINELASHFENENVNTVANLVGLWQGDNPARAEKYPSVSELKSLIDEVRPTRQTLNTFINHSGGATGADSYWSEIGEKYGVRSNHYHAEGNKTPKGNTPISRAELLEADQYLKKANETLGRRFPTNNEYTNNLLRRNWFQVKGADEVFAVSTIKNGIVSGGTAWAVQMAIDEGKPVHVFDQNTNKWYTYESDRWIEESTPTLTPNFAGIGTRNISESGIKAIEDVYNKTVNPNNNQSIVQTAQKVEDEDSDLYTELDKEEFDREEFDEEETNSFETNRNNVSMEELRGVELEYDPIVRRNRVSVISRKFSYTLDKILENRPTEINRKMIEERLSEEEKESLRKELYALSSRKSAIDFYSPMGLFNKVREGYENYVNDTEENRIQAELNRIREEEADNPDPLSEEEMLQYAKEDAEYKYAEYQKILKHFNALADEASLELRTTEALIINPKAFKSSDIVDNTSDSPEGDNNENGDSSMDKEEEGYKDGWMSYYRHVSSHDSLSQAVRKVIREIPRLDYQGFYELDDLGNPIYLDSNYVHAALMDKLKDMITEEDMIPLLKDLARTKKWVEEIIEVLEGDDVLYSQFYQDFRKDWASYWVQRIKPHNNGGFIYETININHPEGTKFLLDKWRDNYEGGAVLTEDSIYNNNGEIVRENARKVLKSLEVLTDKLNNKTTEERLKLLERDGETFKELTRILNAIGIDPNPAILEDAITNIKESDPDSEVQVEYTDPIMLLLPDIHAILAGVAKGEVKTETLEDGTVKNGDLINTFSGAYGNIAEMLSEVFEDAIEASVREGDKSYYGHINPCYLGKLVKQFRNVRGDEAKFLQFIEEEFGQYEWFKKNNMWRSGWLEELINNPKMRKAFQHKILLNIKEGGQSKEYTKWDELDYTKVLLNEYWAEKGNFAWYHVPILSDSPSAEFIRFIRYKTDIKETYQEKLINKFIDIINQEYDRIQLVKERYAKYQGGDTSIEPIANFDIVVDKEGNEIPGGSEFKFIPQLNNYFYKGEKFLDAFERLRNSASSLKEMLSEVIEDIMEKSFEEAYAEWVDIGLLEEDSNGKFVNIPLSVVSQGQSKTNNQVVKALEQAARILGDAFDDNMKFIGRQYRNNKAVNTKQATKVFEEIKYLLDIKLQNNEITQSEFNLITGNLTTKNNAKDALREYFWNSKYATSQIIQLTTTDLAYYKNNEDFQKRYKEVHAPSLRLNTAATFRGKKVGRQWEKTIYLRDDKIISNTLADIEAIFDHQVEIGAIDKPTRDYLVSQFKKINVADAQAYRSLGSYRAMMAMMGQWTDEMETAYEHLVNGEWSINDFNVIWQTKKPYLYSQIKNSSGREGVFLKTPVQHKNSEFLLLALYHTIAGPLAKSGKLKAINEFMEKHEVDVVQFESAVKVGNQGIIDINDAEVNKEIEKLANDNKPHTEYDAVMSILGTTTGLATGNKNPNVVHEVSYEDYGIQTATPEHIIDIEQTIGTQIRKLIVADIVDESIIVDGKPMSKEKLLKTYQAINTENIIQSFREVDEMFSDPKEIERVIQEELRGSVKYSADLQRACTLNENGQFNIPLFDPVQSQRIQTLLNSIIKSRVTKQKIKGGSLIQVTSYGVSEDLKIVYEGKGENKRIKYLECYMPAYSRKFYEHLMDENGVLHIDDWTDSDGKFHKGLPEELRRAIGYRVPTEAKYSMAPLRIKGFLPQQNGSAIMLPAEITTLSGSDFDKLSMLK